MTLLLGLDVGTTAIKALLLDVEQQRPVAVGQVPTPIRYPGDGRSEFDPEGLWLGAATAIRQALAGRHASDVAGVAVASMGEVGVPLDAADRPCYPAITWFDRRTESLVPWWLERVDLERTYRITGQVMHHMYGALKMRWLQEHEPDAWARVAHWLSIEDFMTFRLTGEYATDQSVASRTLLLDQTTGQWSPELLAAAGCPPGLCPSVDASGARVGAVTDGAAAATELLAGTPVSLGGHDHLVGALAVGSATPGALLDSAGTAEGILLTTDRYSPDAALLQAGFSTYRHVVPGRFVVVAGQHGAGGMINWLIDNLYAPSGSERPYALALAEAAAAPVGTGGLFCLPHLRGSRVPERDLRSRAAFVGLVDGHGRGHMLRAALESLGYWLKESLDVLAAATGVAIEQLTVIGGATRSPLWLQIKADCTNLRLVIPETTEAVALGAALLAGVGAGVYPDADAAAAAIPRAVRHVEPDAHAVAQYERARAVYRRLYPALREVNEAILALAQGPDALAVL